MSFIVPSVSDFKAQFPRDFPYAVPAWGARALASVDSAGTITAIQVLAGGQGYKQAPDVEIVDATGTGCTAIATIAKGKVDTVQVNTPGTLYNPTPRILFHGGAGDDTNPCQVQDTEILGAFIDAAPNVGSSLFDDQDGFGRAYGYLSAHFLVEKLLMAGEGMFSQYNWLTASKSVSGISESFVIPQKIRDDPFLSMLSKTRYGAAYITIIAPLLIGNMSVARRYTLP